MLCGLSSDTAFLRVKCLPSVLLPLVDTTDGRAGSQSDWALWMVSTPTTLCLWCLSERRPLWPGCVCQGLGGQRQVTKVMGSQFKMEGGRSKMEIQRAVYLHHGNQFDCQSHAATVCSAHVPLPHITKGWGVQHLLRCIVGPVVVQTKTQIKGGCGGLHAQPSQWRSFRKAGRCLLTKKKRKS